MEKDAKAIWKEQHRKNRLKERERKEKERVNYENQVELEDGRIKQCPHCQHEESLRKFVTWEKDGKRGLLGKTPEGFIMLLCPNCNQEIKYDTLGNIFLEPDQAAKSGIIFNLLFFGFILVVIFFVMKFVF